MKRLCFCIAILHIAVLALGEVTITNLVVAQRPGTKLVDITYDLISGTTNVSPISMQVKNGSNTVTSTTLTGDKGTVIVGANKSIVWNMGADWNGKTASGVVFSIFIAPDGGDPAAVSWEAVNSRWIKNIYANGNITMSDKNTGKMWTYNPNCGGEYGMTWKDATNYCNNLTYAQHSDWELPDFDTLLGAWSQRSVFLSTQGNSYWSSSAYTTYVSVLRGFDGQEVVVTAKTNTFFQVWPVRDATSITAGKIYSAQADLDSRDYILVADSRYGTPIPSMGANVYAWGATVTCSVENAVSGSVNSTCTGWEGTGSVPSVGSGNITGPIVLTNLNSSIKWLWPVSTVSDLWAEQVTAVQRPGTKLVDVSYDLHSTETNSATVSLTVLRGTNSVDVLTASGDVGSGVSTGTVRTVVWDAGADWNGNLDDLTFRILGQDAQGAGVETPAGRVRIPAGGNEGSDPDSGAYSLTVTNSLFMDASEVTKAQWDAVYSWAVTNGYSFANAGSATAANHPVQTVSWIDAVKWCNARSEMEGFVPCYSTNDWSCNLNANGYRLPTVEEWQYAARGGLSGKRFPWGDTIAHSNAVYYSSSSLAYDVSPTRGFHPSFGAGTASEQTGTDNGYGLFAMAGNVMEWCNDLSGGSRVLAGGSFDQFADAARCSYTTQLSPSSADYNIGFRTVQRASSSASAETGSAVPVDTRDYLLTVESAHGSPVPNIGTNVYAWHATVTASVDSAVISGLTNWTSAGWSGAGSVPPEDGTANTGAFVLTNPASSITWNWNTNYWLETVTNGTGQVTGGNRWVAQGSNVTLSITLASGWLFMGWSGDVTNDYTEANIIIPVVRPISVTATFSDDADGDGLLNTNETALGTNPRNRDSDGDGLSDPNELVAGTSPTNSASVLDIQLNLSGSANELSWYGVSGRYYQLEYTDNLGQSWIPKGTVVSGANSSVLKLDIGAGEKRFYRIRVSGSPDDL